MERLVGVRVWDGLKVGVRVRGADVSGGIGARNRHETPGGSGATVGCSPASGRDGLRRRERSGYGGTRDGVRRRFRRGEGCRGGLAGGNEGAGDFRQIRPAVGVLTGADEDRGADHRHAIPGNVKSGDVAPAIDRRGQQTQQGEVLHAADPGADRGGALHQGVLARLAGTRSFTVMVPPVLVMDSSATGFGLKLGTVGGRSNWLSPRWARAAFTRTK